MNSKRNLFEYVARIHKIVTRELKVLSEERFSRAFKVLYIRSKSYVDVGEN